MDYRKFVIPTISGILLGGGYSTSAIAQDAATAVVEEDSVNRLETINVTARFREESVQTTPIAISAVSGDSLLESGGLDITQIAKQTPNILLEDGGTALGKSASVTIRGIGEGDYNLAVEGAVGFYVDDVFHSTVFGSLFDLLDVERVEVLRGPQGTLFGKNSIGGAIRLVSNEPQGDGSTSIRLTAGSFNRFEVRGHIDRAIGDNTAIRIAGNMRQRDGYQDVLDFACFRPSLAGDGTAPLAGQLGAQRASGGCKTGTQGGESVSSWKASLKSELSDKLTVLIAADYLNDDGEAAPSYLIEPGNFDAPTPLGSLNDFRFEPLYGVPFDDRFVPPDVFSTFSTHDANLTGLPLPNKNTVQAWGLRGVVDYDLTDKLSLKSITGFRTYEGEFNRDADQSPLEIGGSRTEIEHEQFSQELRLSGLSFNDSLEWTVGAFYFDSESLDQSNVHIMLWFYEPTALRVDDPAETTTLATFAHGIWSVTDRLNFSAGLRYSDEEKSYTFSRTYAAPNVVFFRPTVQLNVGDDFFPLTKVESSYDRFDWKLGVDYQLTDNVMVYGLASTGFRGGGFNPRPLFQNDISSVEPEELTSYEAGVKSDLFDDMLRFNATVFFGEYTNLQQTAVDDVSNIVRLNVGEAEIKGLELETQFRPTPNLTLSGTLGLTDFEYTDLGTAADPSISNRPTLNSVPVRSPDTTYTLGAEYIVPSSLGDVTIGANYSHRSKVFYDPPNTEAYAQDGFGLLSARIGWRAPDDSWGVSLNATNLTDEEYFSSINVGSSAGVLGTPGRPQEFSISIDGKF